MALSDHQEQKTIVDRFAASVKSGKVAHAYIIEGDTVSDKPTFARNMLKAVLCHDRPGDGCDRCSVCRRINDGNYEDLIMVEPEDGKKSIGVEPIEKLIKELSLKATAQAGRKIALIEKGDALTPAAQNKLLKTLEEPQAGALILILSANTQNLLPTVRSRCVCLRLSMTTAPAEDGWMQVATQLMEMIAGDAYFYKIKKKLDGKIKNTEDAEGFLDGTERVLRQYMVSGDSPVMDRQKALQSVRLVEEARRDLMAGVNYKYALRNLALKIGG